MKKIITKVFIIFILSGFCGSIFAAGASCSAQNKRTGQFFSASGNGETQTAATEDAKNNVLQICKQSSNSAPEECELGNCYSY